MKLLPNVLGVISLTVAVNAFADETTRDVTGWYVGGQIGWVDSDLSSDYGVSASDNTAGFGSYGGYNFTPWFGLEAKVFLTGDLDDSSDSSNSSAGYFSVSALPTFTWHINDTFALYGQAGLALAGYAEEYEDDFEEIDAGWGGIILHYTAGVQFALPHQLNLRAGYEVRDGELETDDRYFGVELPDVDTKLTQVFVSLHYQF